MKWGDPFTFKDDHTGLVTPGHGVSQGLCQESQPPISVTLCAWVCVNGRMLMYVYTWMPELTSELFLYHSLP